MTLSENRQQLSYDWGVDHFDPWDRRITYQNIWPIYQNMRDAAPVVHSDALGGFWCVTRYAEVREVARDPQKFSSNYSLAIGKANWPKEKKTSRLIETDPPQHTRKRKAMQAPLLLKKMDGFADAIRAEVRQSLDRIADLGEFDIVSDLAEPVPQEALADILGFDEETRKRNRELVLDFVHSDLSRSKETQENFMRFLEETIQVRLDNPGNDFLSELCHMEVDGERFSKKELVGMLHGFALAGHHTSIDGISSMLRRVADDNIKAAYLNDPSIAQSIVEESLRIDSPIHLEGRSTTQKVVVGGIEIPEGESIALLYASANHDERQFEDPDTFIATRQGNQHLAFGHGIHMCIGMHLARLEMKTVLEEMMARFPNYKLVGRSTDSGMTFGHHMGWDSMPASIG